MDCKKKDVGWVKCCPLLKEDKLSTAEEDNFFNFTNF